MLKALLAALAAALLLLAGAAPASTLARQELAIPMSDGTGIAATLYLPEGTPPAGGWPALVFLHGLAGNRQQMNALVEGFGFADGTYAVLTFDARGHGESGGLVTVDGPREVEDVRALHAWLAARPDVSDTRIAAWGISYGGGAIWNSLVAGVPWAAAATFETWTDLYDALLPQGLVKSGLVAGLAGSIPEARRDPSLAAVQAAAFAGNTAAVRPWALERSSLARLDGVTTPVLLAQGRRDFLFGIDQGSRAFQRLRGPKALYIGLHGHAPSTFPAADTPLLMTRVREWFDCHLGVRTCTPPTGVFVSPERFAGQLAQSAALPRTRTSTFALPGVTTFAQRGKAVRRTARLSRALEVFGAPTVEASIAASGGWSRLVAVLSARVAGREVVVSAGGVPVQQGARKVAIRLIDQATFLPRGTRLTLTLASASTAQSPSNLLYLDLPMAAGARVRVGTVVLKLPVLRTPVTR
ncbi:MAG TPA: alpha/beta fold hydrolase [Gaiellaceae bacterium]|nr:alpha/beta fold hydrolase [Gaiellaceae bacterium]